MPVNADRKTTHPGALIPICLLLAVAIPAAATQFTVESSFPAIYAAAPADLTLEGAVDVTATADAAVTLLDDPAWLVQTGEFSWTTLYRWYETTPRQARFVDAAQETLAVTFQPAPRLPLDFARHALPVVCITTAPANLWDPEIGIYAWGYHSNFLQHGDAWERPATLDYYTSDGVLEFSEPIGLRINGETSRAFAQKGLRLYFDDYGASDFVEHDFFGDGPVRCERLVLRNGAYPDFAIGSGWAEPLHRDLGHPGSRYRYVAVYLNGEYWGAYALRERYDGQWVETTHEWADDDYVVIKDHAAVDGDYQRWEDFLDGVAEGDPASHAWYQWLDGRLDITSYLDWVFVNAMGHTADNMHGKNLGILKVGGDRWRFLAWDEDILFQVPNRNADHLSFYASADAAEFFLHEPNDWFSGGPWDFTFRWNALLRRGMQNAQFKDRLRTRTAELLDGAMSIRSMNDRLDALAAVQAPEWAHHEVRWNPPGSYNYRLTVTRGSLAYRHDVLGDLVEQFLDTWAEPAELIAFDVQAGVGQAALSWRTARELDCDGWRVERSLDEPDQFAVIASYLDEPALVAAGGPDLPADYAWVDPDLPPGRDAFYRLSHVGGLGTPRVHDWIEQAGLGPEFNLRLNEFMADNDTTVADEMGEYDDWLEVFNAGDEPVGLAGLFLSDNLENPAKWALPELVLEAGGFLLVWCDEDLDQGPLHASFKLSAGGEELGLFAGFAAGNAPIDTLVFGAQAADVSLGRWPDGDGAWAVMDRATPGGSNDPEVGVDDPSSTLVRLAPAWPNPATGGLTVRGRVSAGVGPVALRVYSVRGELVRELTSGRPLGDRRTWTWDGRDGAGRQAAAGVYLLRLEAGGQVSRQSAVLVR